MYDVERVEKPRFFGIRPTSRGRGKRIPFVIGFDSEADSSCPVFGTSITMSNSVDSDSR